MHRHFISLNPLAVQVTRVLRQIGASRERINVNGKPVRNAPCGDRRGDRRAAVLVALVILNDENGTDSALFAADDRLQICEVYLASPYVFLVHFTFSLCKIPALCIVTQSRNLYIKTDFYVVFL